MYNIRKSSKLHELKILSVKMLVSLVVDNIILGSFYTTELMLLARISYGTLFRSPHVFKARFFYAKVPQRMDITL